MSTTLAQERESVLDIIDSRPLVQRVTPAQLSELQSQGNRVKRIYICPTDATIIPINLLPIFSDHSQPPRTDTALPILQTRKNTYCPTCNKYEEAVLSEEHDDKISYPSTRFITPETRFS